jgi:hypothetical protein
MKLIVYFISVIIITSVPIGIIAYTSSYKTIEDLMLNSSNKEMVQVDNSISDILFKDIKENAALLANNSEVKKADNSILALFNMSKEKTPKKFSKNIPGIESAIYNEFEKYAKTHPDSAYVYLGTKWGGYIQWPDGLDVNNYDPRVRPWYKQSIKNPDKIMISDPYMSTDSSKAVIISTTSCVRNASGEIVGVLGLDVNLAKLSELLKFKNITIGAHGYMFIYTKNGTIISHPNTALTFKNIKKLSTGGEIDKTTGKIIKYNIKDYSKFIDETAGSFETEINGIPCLVSIYLTYGHLLSI